MSDTWTIGELAERAADLLSQERHVHGQEPQDDRDDGPEPGSVKGQEPRVSGPEPRANSPQQQANGPEQRVDGPQQRANGRVRELPNERLIRWYTTIGLLDPPLGGAAGWPSTAAATCSSSWPSSAVRRRACPSPPSRRS
ncbi:hypothetical protein GCM10027612_37450 [Microbispora bryophytorum subsp. camponoti]